MTPVPDQLLAALMRRQFGTCSRAQALACGIPDRTITNRLRSGRWRPLLPGVMAEAGTPDRWELRAMAALLAVGGEAVLARQSAARLHGLDLPPGVSPDLAVLVHNRTFPVLPEGITVHRTRRLPWSDVAGRTGLPVTTPARTICDLAGQVGPIALRRTVADAVRQGLTTADELRSTVGGLGRIPGKRHLLEVCDELSPLEADCRSEVESAFLRLATRVGLPPTAMNHSIVDVHGHPRFIDAVYLPHHVPVELDSRAHHGTGVDWNDDLRRANAIVVTGWEPFLRFSWWDVRARPGQVVDILRAALARAAARRGLPPGRQPSLARSSRATSAIQHATVKEHRVSASRPAMAVIGTLDRVWEPRGGRGRPMAGWTRPGDGHETNRDGRGPGCDARTCRVCRADGVRDREGPTGRSRRDSGHDVGAGGGPVGWGSTGDPAEPSDHAVVDRRRHDRGESACNPYSVGPDVDEVVTDRLFPLVANSERGCPDDATLRLEEAYLTALRETTTAAGEDTALTLQGPRSTLVYALDEPAVGATPTTGPTAVDPATTEPTPIAPTGADPTATATPGATDVGPLAVDGTWVLEAGMLDGVALEVVDSARVDLTPMDGQIVGRSGCNGYGAEATVDGDRIEITSLGGTDVACVERLMDLESTYLAALPRVTTIDRDEGRLTLYGDDVKLTFHEEPPLSTGALVGTRWELELLVSGTTTTPADGDGFLLLDLDGNMTGSTGCRALTGEWVAVGSGLVIPTMAADGTCEPGLADQDAHVVDVLEDMDVAIDGDRLTLTSLQGEADGAALVYVDGGTGTS